jgi:hypothetical protein
LSSGLGKPASRFDQFASRLPHQTSQIGYQTRQNQGYVSLKFAPANIQGASRILKSLRGLEILQISKVIKILKAIEIARFVEIRENHKGCAFL